MTSKKIEALIDREGAAFVVASRFEPAFIASSEALAVEAAHAEAWVDQVRARVHDRSARGYMPTIYRLPLNQMVRRDDTVLFEYDYRSEEWTRLADGKLPAQAKRTRPSFFAAERAGTSSFEYRPFPHDPTVTDWVWSERYELSLIRAAQFGVFTSEAKAIEVTKPTTPLYGVADGGETASDREHLIRGVFLNGHFGYRSGHGLADPRHPSHG